MHDTARETGRRFFELYAREARNVLDVGALDVNGTLKPFVPERASYCGCDIKDGPNVSVELSDPYRLPFAASEFDVVVSTSCLEHNPMFWLTFSEMARVAGQYIYISVPAAGHVHRFPVDCWRFYPDAGTSLELWARREGHDISLLESFILPPRAEGWWDFVAVFGKEGFSLARPSLLSFFPEIQEF